MFILAGKIMVSHQTLSLMSIRYLADTTVKVNKISIWIIPNSLEFRRIFNAIRSKLIIFANCRPWYIFHTSIRFCNGSVICGKRNQFILLIKGKDTACRLSFVTDCRPYFKLTFFIISPIPLQILSAVLNGSQKILQIRQVVQK